MLIGWDRGHFFLNFVSDEGKITNSWLDKRQRYSHLIGWTQERAFCILKASWNEKRILSCSTQRSLQTLTFNRVGWWKSFGIGCLSLKRSSKSWTYMCYGKQQMVIGFKTTENFGATWSIIFPARSRGSFATQVNKIYLVWVLSVFCQWTRDVFIS